MCIIVLRTLYSALIIDNLFAAKKFLHALFHVQAVSYIYMEQGM